VRSAWGKGAREGPAPQKAGKISSQCSAKAGTTWARMRKTGQVGRDEEGSARTEEDHVINVIMIAESFFDIMFLFQENKSYGVKTICIDPLSTCSCTSCRKH
jgi:hypothetical protein